MIVSDSKDSDDDEILDDHNETANFMAFDGSKSGGGVNMKSFIKEVEGGYL